MAKIGKSIRGIIVLARPINCLLTAGSVVVGAVAGGLGGAPVDIAMAALAAALITGAGNALNDVQDIEEDRINQPQRPLPAGLVSPLAAIVMVGLLVVSGLGLAWWVSPVAGMIATAVALTLMGYSIWLKQTGPAGNILVAALAATTFPYGALVGGDLGRSWIPATFAFLYHLGREVVKGVEDMEGDQRRDIRTLALRVSPIAAGRVTALLLGLVALLALLPWTVGIYGIGYGLPVVLLDAFILAWFPQLWRGAPRGRLSRRLLVGMALGLLAICLGEVLEPLPPIP
ncbi:MAG: geranylgeranylglycerol-phosphate geranylgeranyltransferase [Candidatus Latescibacterota bacterium]|nr:geranylgeranylglycerol-phosphate geranylgeranyltransferase [Candidatus Latescibacterota bacterium]